jgi:hypothetical protein
MFVQGVYGSFLAGIIRYQDLSLFFSKPVACRLTELKEYSGNFCISVPYNKNHYQES